MSYQRTDVALYGIELPFADARRAYLEISERQFRREAAVESQAIYGDRTRESVGDWSDIIDELEHCIDPFEFFEKYTFIQRLVPPDRVQVEPRLGSPPRERYFSDFRSDGTQTSDEQYFSHDAATPHVFGIYLASNGYAYLDDLAAFTANVSPIAIANFREYCLPELERLGIRHEPRVRILSQVW